jgi:hypothetical protein
MAFLLWFRFVLWFDNGLGYHPREPRDDLGVLSFVKGVPHGYDAGGRRLLEQL